MSLISNLTRKGRVAVIIHDAGAIFWEDHGFGQASLVINKDQGRTILIINLNILDYLSLVVSKICPPLYT